MNGHTPLLLPAIGIPVLLLVLGSIALFQRHRSLPCFLQLLGTGALMLVVLSHVAEVFRLLPWMRWGLERSAGHYLDLGSAVVGLALFPVGYVLHAFAAQSMPLKSG